MLILVLEASTASATTRKYRKDSVFHTSLYKRTGCPIHTTYTLWKYIHEKESGNTDNAAFIASMPDYLFLKLTGEFAASKSTASAGGFLNLHTLLWDEEALRLAGINGSMLPRLVDSEYSAALSKDAAIRNAVLMDESVLTDPTEMDKMVETAVYKHVAAFYYQKAICVGYYRAGKKSKEIDIVVDYPNIDNILIEVKYREQAPVADDDAICELAGEASAAIVVTKRADDYRVHNTQNGKILLRIPAFAFLYLLGHAERNGYKGAE